MIDQMITLYWEVRKRFFQKWHSCSALIQDKRLSLTDYGEGHAKDNQQPMQRLQVVNQAGNFNL